MQLNHDVLFAAVAALALLGPVTAQSIDDVVAPCYGLLADGVCDATAATAHGANDAAAGALADLEGTDPGPAARGVLLSGPVIVWTNLNMGPASGLDADTVDGVSSETLIAADDALAAAIADEAADRAAADDALAAAIADEIEARTAADDTLSGAIAAEAAARTAADNALASASAAEADARAAGDGALNAAVAAETTARAAADAALAATIAAREPVFVSAALVGQHYYSTSWGRIPLTAAVDPAGLWDNTRHAFVAPATGTYAVSGDFYTAAHTYVRVYVNGVDSDLRSVGTYGTSLSNQLVALDAGDIVEFRGTSGSGSAPFDHGWQHVTIMRV